MSSRSGEDPDCLRNIKGLPYDDDDDDVVESIPVSKTQGKSPGEPQKAKLPRGRKRLRGETDDKTADSCVQYNIEETHERIKERDSQTKDGQLFNFDGHDMDVKATPAIMDVVKGINANPDEEHLDSSSGDNSDKLVDLIEEAIRKLQLKDDWYIRRTRVLDILKSLEYSTKCVNLLHKKGKRQKRIILENTNRPCYLVGICNNLILRGRMSLDENETVFLDILVEKLLKKASKKGLNISKEDIYKLTKPNNVTITSTHSIDCIELGACKEILTLFNIRLYHGCIYKDDSTTESKPPKETGSLTENGLDALKETPYGYAILFRDKHLNVMFQLKSEVYILANNERYGEDEYKDVVWLKLNKVSDVTYIDENLMKWSKRSEKAKRESKNNIARTNEAVGTSDSEISTFERPVDIMDIITGYMRDSDKIAENLNKASKTVKLVNGIKICSWNVNQLHRLKGDEKENFLAFLENKDFDIICLQEVRYNCKVGDSHSLREDKTVEGKALNDILHSKVLTKYECYWSLGKNKYNGVAMFVKKKYKQPSICKEKVFENEDRAWGRYIIAEFDEFIVFNTYPHNTGCWDSRKKDEEVKLIAYDRAEFLSNCGLFIFTSTKPVIWVGDFNVRVCTPSLESVLRVKSEQLSFYRLLNDCRMYDVFYLFNRDLINGTTSSSKSHTYKSGSKMLRLDYIFAPKNFIEKYVIGCSRHPEGFFGSDHCPLSLEFRPRSQ